MTMSIAELRALLESVASGRVDAGDAERRVIDALRARPFEDLGFARVDHHRSIRQGFPEVVLGLGKTPAQIAAIAAEIAARGSTLLVTRASEAAFEAVRARAAGRRLSAEAGLIVLSQQDIVPETGRILVIAAGTSDLFVAEEAAGTAS